MASGFTSLMLPISLLVQELRTRVKAKVKVKVELEEQKKFFMRFISDSLIVYTHGCSKVS
jgi:hypothetical protein